MPLTVVLKTLVRKLYSQAYLGDDGREADHHSFRGDTRRV
ncbi:MAG: hypothetical protein Nkreftii_002301 [Candidatus Nitrospira kreftii]|uniref:Uncharacterized protein n=1 Tax=Candidatus Nitrospira kreftii TaxID=2652173 RepID=A0A7S8FER2_9BACT|nr:MAG: hypothetical protein Nkreftii_002301 [Candidatus Nitrospira kreftii]